MVSGKSIPIVLLLRNPECFSWFKLVHQSNLSCCHCRDFTFFLVDIFVLTFYFSMGLLDSSANSRAEKSRSMCFYFSFVKNFDVQHFTVVSLTCFLASFLGYIFKNSKKNLYLFLLKIIFLCVLDRFNALISKIIF
jgi:hypothetical protein